MAAGKPNSVHLIAICEFGPPYWVISPLIFLLKIQSNPGSADSIQTIIFSMSNCSKFLAVTIIISLLTDI